MGHSFIFDNSMCLYQPLEAAVSQRSTTFGREGGLGQIEEAQALVEATHLLDQVGNSWQKRREDKALIQHHKTSNHQSRGKTKLIT